MVDPAPSTKVAAAAASAEQAVSPPKKSTAVTQKRGVWAVAIEPPVTAVVMVLAAMFHFSRGEYSLIAINALLGGMAAFVAWGRWKKAPIAARS